MIGKEHVGLTQHTTTVAIFKRRDLSRFHSTFGVYVLATREVKKDYTAANDWDMVAH